MTDFTLSLPVHRLKRRARDRARASGRKLAPVLDEIAREEGFRAWSHLAASLPRPGAALFDRLVPGDLVLLGARPGQGKTLLGLELAATAAARGLRGEVLTLEYHAGEVAARLRDLGFDPRGLGPGFAVDASDGICADHVMARMQGAPRGSVAVIDYLQLLDQKRSHPPLDDQVRQLRAGAARAGLIIVALSQIDRAFDLSGRAHPGPQDIRMPNPMDPELFTRCVFIGDGVLRMAG